MPLDIKTAGGDAIVRDKIEVVSINAASIEYSTRRVS